MSMASGSNLDVIAAVTKIPKANVNLNWKIENFKALLEITDKKLPNHVPEDPSTIKPIVLSELPFVVHNGRNYADTMSLKWNLIRFKYAKTSYDRIGYAITTTHVGIGIKLTFESEKLKNNALQNLFVGYYAEISVGNLKTFTHTSPIQSLEDFQAQDQRRWHMFDEIDKHVYLNSDGSLTMNLKVCIYFNNDGTNTVVTHEESKTVMTEILPSQMGLLNSIKSLLGDEHTSDVVLSVTDEHGKELGKFFCHTTIFSAQSRVFRTMFQSKSMSEAKRGVVQINDATVGAVDRLVYFLYCGKLQGESLNGTEETSWVDFLPELTYMAHKYEIKTLLDFCDRNLHEALAKFNAVEILKLAKRHGLTRAVSKLRNELAGNIDFLMDSIE